MRFSRELIDHLYESFHRRTVLCPHFSLLTLSRNYVPQRPWVTIGCVLLLDLHPSLSLSLGYIYRVLAYSYIVQSLYYSRKISGIVYALLSPDTTYIYTLDLRRYRTFFSRYCKSSRQRTAYSFLFPILFFVFFFILFFGFLFYTIDTQDFVSVFMIYFCFCVFICDTTTRQEYDSSEASEVWCWAKQSS